MRVLGGLCASPLFLHIALLSSLLFSLSSLSRGLPLNHHDHPLSMSLIHQPSWPAPTDSVATKTSEEQAQVETVIHDLFLPFLTSSDGEAGLPPPSLARLTHISFLKKGLQPLPAGYVGFDSTRPWLVYWATHAAYLLAMPFAEDVRQRAVSTLLSCQSPQGGFAGGPGQMPHLMATYAAVCALAINGAPVPAPGLKDAKEDVGKGGWDAIDR